MNTVFYVIIAVVKLIITYALRTDVLLVFFNPHHATTCQLILLCIFDDVAKNADVFCIMPPV